jgi:hypothetical protein
VWVLGGCGGCFAVVVIAATLFVNGVSKEFKKPISEAQVRQELGPEVPLYPGGVFEPVGTRLMRSMFGMVGMRGEKGVFRGIGAYRVSDDAEKIFAWYDKELTSQGWKQVQASQSNQRIYQKDNKDVIMVQVQEGSSTGGRMVVLIRGGPALVQKMKDK